MSKELYIDGNTGRVAIFEGGYEGAIHNPLGNLDRTYFHSDLNYMGVQTILEFDVYHPRRHRGKSVTGWGPWTDIRYEPLTGDQYYDGPWHGLGYTPQAMAHTGGRMISGGLLVQEREESRRSVSMLIDDNRVRLFETWYTFDSDLVDYTASYRVVIFSGILGPSGNDLMLMQGDLFTASRGRLSSNRDYLRKVNDGGDFRLTAGKTGDISNSSVRYVDPNGQWYTQSTYNGGFFGDPSTGVRQR